MVVGFIKAFYLGAQAKHARSCPRYQHDSFGTDLRRVLREEHEDDSTDDHTEEVDEEITSLFCIPCMLWLNGHAQMIDHVMGKKHRKQSARWMQIDRNRATPVERVTPETLQRALLELTDMFAKEYKRLATALSTLEDGDVTMLQTSACSSTSRALLPKVKPRRDVKKLGRHSRGKGQCTNKLRVRFESGFGEFIRIVGRDYLAERTGNFSSALFTFLTDPPKAAPPTPPPGKQKDRLTRISKSEFTLPKGCYVGMAIYRPGGLHGFADVEVADNPRKLWEFFLENEAMLPSLDASMVGVASVMSLSCLFDKFSRAVTAVVLPTPNAASAKEPRATRSAGRPSLAGRVTRYAAFALSLAAVVFVVARQGNGSLRLQHSTTL